MVGISAAKMNPLAMWCCHGRHKLVPVLSFAFTSTTVQLLPLPQTAVNGSSARVATIPQAWVQVFRGLRYLQESCLGEGPTFNCSARADGPHLPAAHLDPMWALVRDFLIGEPPNH